MATSLHRAAAVALPPPEVLTVDGVHKRFDRTEVLRGASLGVAAGKVLALLGPSGCGKTTLLRVIAGLETPDAGRVIAGERLLSDGVSVVRPERRRVGMVFQDWALFPHLSVAGNVGYGLHRALDRDERVAAALEMVGLAGFADRRPGTLSGGQQQRVAIARAVAPRPAVLLLDEPFSNLDATLRAQVRGELRALLADLGVTTVVVTHDQEEAFILGDEVAVMRAGVIAQQATPAELYARPADPWVAAFVGDANLVPGTVRRGVATTAVGRVKVTPPAEGKVPAGEVVVLLRPETLRLEPGEAGMVERLEYHGHDSLYEVTMEGGDRLLVRAGSVPQFAAGDRVDVVFTGPPATVFPA